jgi:hypothetical protein
LQVEKKLIYMPKCGRGPTSISISSGHRYLRQQLMSKGPPPRRSPSHNSFFGKAAWSFN